MSPGARVLLCAAVALASGAWGLYWLPQRALEAGGLTGGWGTIAQYVIPLVLMAPIALWRASRGRSTGLGLPLEGLLLGGGIVCYADSFLLTDVVRALLLFYLTPVWATLFELLVLRQRPPRVRPLSIALGLAGIWIVFGPEGGIPLPENAGDWLALAGGAMIAAGATRVQARQPDGVFPLLFAFFLYGGLVAIACSLVLADVLGPMPTTDAWLDMLPWLVLLAVVFLIPTDGLLIWSPSRLGAGLFGILIMTEVVFGIASAALWADEPFGWREAAGAALVLAAGLAEVLWPFLPRRPRPCPEAGP